MSHRLLASLLLIFSLFTIPASAQQGDPPPAAKTEALTPDQAKRALDTLSDDKKRAEMIETLRAIANATPQPAPEAKPAIPLTADSLGAQLLLTVSEQVGEISREVADVARTLTHYRAFYWWFLRTANDPAAYQQLLDIAWRLALVFVCAFAAEWLAFRLIQRPVAFLEARVPQAAQAPAQTLALADPPSSSADIAAPAQQRRRLSLARTWQSLLRLPFVLGRLMLELLPVLVFIGMSTMLLGTAIGDMMTTRLVILAVVNAYALSRVMIC
ncbi:MAG: small-conductance mechanosensitive channel, partial [Bradyrhizobium sp.]